MRSGRLGDPPKHPGGIDHAGHQTPILHLWCSRFDTVARGEVEANDVIPPELHIGDAHVHHEVIGPLLDLVRLQNEGECAELHLHESVG